MINSKSVYARRKYKKIDKVPFIVLIGTVSPTSLTNFLEEYFHTDHIQDEEVTRHCVLMQPYGPEKIPDLHLILNKSKYLINLQYIEGSALEPQDLERCLIEKADAVIILSDKFSYDADQQDSHTILEAMLIKKYLSKQKKKGGNNSTMVCMQLLRYQSITHYELSNYEETKNDRIVCIESLKLSLLAKSCLCPGLVVLITNLIKSSLDSNEIDMFLDEKKDDPNYQWLY